MEKTVIVTGGTVRIGAAISHCLRQNGWKVITVSSRSDSAADIIADLASEHECGRIIDKATRLSGGAAPLALVNNAALFAGEKELVESINLRSPLRLIDLMKRCAAEDKMRRSIVNILDTRILNRKNAGKPTPYEMSKLELLKKTIELSRNESEFLRVNAIAPGPVLPPVQIHEKSGRMLVERPTADDVAAGVLFLLETPSVTGTVIPVDAGQHLLHSDSD